MTSRFTRACAIAAVLALTAAMTGCDTVEEAMTAPTTTQETYQADVTGPGSKMSAAGCEKFTKEKTKPLECQPLPKGQAYLYVKTGAGEYGKQEYVGVDQFQATCTPTTTTVTGPDDLTLTFTRDSRTVKVSQGGTSLGSYSDDYLWWINHTDVMTNGTNKLGDGEIAVSMRAHCEEPDLPNGQTPTAQPAV